MLWYIGEYRDGGASSTLVQVYVDDIFT